MLQQEKLVSLLNKVMNQYARLRKGSMQAMYHCPFCNEQKKVPKLEICLDGIDLGNWHCWICNARGSNLKSLFFKLKAAKQYVDELFSIVGYQYRPRKNATDIQETPSLPQGFKPLSKNVDDYEFDAAWYYLAKRGVTRNDVLRYNIGYCDRGEYEKRIVVPSYDKDGSLNFFSARDYTEQSRYKYMLSPWSKNIIGFEVFINWDEPVTIVEGAFDAFAVKNNVIPLFGTTLPFVLKLALVENKVKRVNLLLDSDALKRAIDIYDRLEDLLGDRVDVHLIKLNGKDPSVMGFEVVDNIIKTSKPLDFLDLIKHKMEI